MTRTWRWINGQKKKKISSGGKLRVASTALAPQANVEEDEVERATQKLSFPLA